MASKDRMEVALKALHRIREDSYPGDYYTESFWEDANKALTALGESPDPRVGDISAVTPPTNPS